jgi:LmbE family N-acetylglucosaminyl deacetylase
MASKAIQWLRSTSWIEDTMTFPDKPVRPTLLAVLAHPDDESFGIGGTLARYAWSGAEVHLICATGGELGDVEASLLEGYASVAERRKAELDCAAKALGLASVTMLGYRDSGMAGTPANEHPEALAAQELSAVAARVATAIRRLRPQVVITFDPIGGYRHPDHIAMHQATVAAFALAGDSAWLDALPPYAPQKLYFHTFGRRLLRSMVRLMPLLGQNPRRFGRNQDVDLAALAEVEFPIHARIDILSVQAAREAAGACHVSQGGAAPGGPLGRLFNAAFRIAGGYETFMRAHPAAPPGLRETDLFAGVVL